MSSARYEAIGLIGDSNVKKLESNGMTVTYKTVEMAKDERLKYLESELAKSRSELALRPIWVDIEPSDLSSKKEVPLSANRQRA
jgi:hypothetical protein